MKFWFVLTLGTGFLCAQQAPVPPQPVPSQKETIVVTGTAAPIPLAESDRDVSVVLLPVQQRPLYYSWFDLLQLDPALDLQQRAPGGFQADLSIRGATWGQTLVLLNGMRLNDVQTGHFNLDLPVPLEAVTGMEVLKGSGSALYGSDAIGGVVNIRTEPIEGREFRILTGLGNFGTNQQHALGTFGGAMWQEELAFTRDLSTGFAPDRDYRNLALSSLTLLKSRLGATSLLFAESDRPYGANQFYGNYPSWERNKSWFASAHQDLGDNTEASFAFRRHTDLFILFRYSPEIYTNRHAAESWQGDLRRHDKLPGHAVLSYGVEGLAESVASTNLGAHDRKRGGGYVFYDIRSVRRFSLSAGIREEFYGAGSVVTSPSLSGAAWLSSKLKLRAAASRAYRLPGYTDLYYHDPANVGNPNLKPESATSYEGGLEAWLRPELHASVTVFQRRDTNVIDYVRASVNDVWQATNFDKLHFTGVEAATVFEPRPGQHFAVSYSALHGASASAALLQSKYAFNYPVHSAVAEWRGSLGGKFLARTRLGIVDRLQRKPYAIWDASASYSTGRIRPFLQLTNITSTVYQEIPAVVMPKRGILGGVEFFVFGGNK